MILILMLDAIPCSLGSMKRISPNPKPKVQRIIGCKHRRSWIIGNGSYEWCYECGAFRGLRVFGSSATALVPSSPWVHPTGIPYGKWERAKERWEQIRAEVVKKSKTL